RVASGAYRLDEERRLFYVALTRARSHVLLSGSWFGAGVKALAASPYVTELVDAGHVAVGVWEDCPEDGAPVAAVAEPVPWPRRVTAAQESRRALADRVRLARATLPASGWDERLPLAREIAVMLAERASRSRNSGDVVLPAHLSTSALVAMRRDRDAFARQLRRPIPVEPTAAAHTGSALHAWIEARFGHVPLWEDEDAPGDEALALSVLKETFLASEWAGRTPSHVEADVELPMGGVTIRSRIDAVFAPGEGLDRVTVVDWKSGKPPVDPDERRAREVQLAMYRLAWAARQGLGVDEVDAAFYYVGADVTVRPEQLLGRTEIEALISG
ncbi:MAG: ATP-dependent helicase, partial [Demequinaceae bacterium]|nr:ATP-dependent helicase [Demequinaceae bacterium]